MSDRCKMPPKGWICTRPAGHDGPCAAIHLPPLTFDDLVRMGANVPLPKPTEPDGAEIVGDVEYDSIRDRWQPASKPTDRGGE